METIGIFEAKTKLSEICDKVAEIREPVLITKRGKPLVRIDPLEERAGIWEVSKEFRKSHKIKDDIDLPQRAVEEAKFFFD